LYKRFLPESIYHPGGALIEVPEIHKDQEVKVLVKVVKRKGESEQQLMHRFRKAVSRSGKMSEVRKRRWFISKNEERRLAKKKAIRRLKRRQWKRERRR
jgi:small subunit ribosomal protein S21